MPQLDVGRRSPDRFSAGARRDAQRRAMTVLGLAAMLLLALAIAPIIVATRARVHRRLIADMIEPARIATGEMETARLRRLLATGPSPAPSSERGVTPADAIYRATLDSAAAALGPDALRRVAAFETVLRPGGSNEVSNVERVAAALRIAAATDSMQGWLDQRIIDERAAATAIERWDVWLPAILVPLCLLGILAVAIASRQVMTLSRAAQHDAAALSDAVSAKASLLRGITHDLKNPLGAAQGYTELLAEGLLGEVTGRSLDAVQRVHRLLGVALGTLEELTELSRAESGEIGLVLAEVRLDRLVAECVEDHRSAARLRDLSLTAVPPDAGTKGPTVRSDERRVRQVLDNLVGNAIKYTPQGGAVRIHVAVQSHRPEVFITVSDTGPGIPAEMRTRVFEEFYRLDRDDRDAMRDAPQGTGIGLAISRQVARLLGGDLSVEAAEGGGAAFILSIPISPPDRTSVAKPGGRGPVQA